MAAESDGPYRCCKPGPGRARDEGNQQENTSGRDKEHAAGSARGACCAGRPNGTARCERRRQDLKLSIDVGTEQRTLVAGIAEAYEPEQLVGRTIVIVFNLKPAKLMGIESNGMVLAASADGGKPILVSFDQDVPLGARVR